MFDVLPTQEYEAVTLAFWQAKIPDLEEISISVRIGGEVVRFARVSPDSELVEFNSDECHAALIGG